MPASRGLSLLLTTLLLSACRGDLVEPRNNDEVKLVRHLITSIGDLFLEDREDEEREKAVQELAALARRPDGVAKIVEVNGIKYLVATAKEGKSTSQRVGAATTLAWIARDSEANTDIIVKHDGIETFVVMIRHGQAAMKKAAMLALNAMVNVRPDVAWQVAELGGIATIINLLRDGDRDEKSKAITSLNMISRQTTVRDNTTLGELIILTGGASALVSFVHTGNEDQVVKALMTISNLAPQTTGAARALCKAGAIKMLVASIKRGSDVIQQWASLGLALLLRGEPKSRDQLGEEDGISGMIDLARGATGLRKRHALMALVSAMAQHTKNVKHAVDGGAIPVLLDAAMNDADAVQKREATMALAHIAADSDEHLVSITAAGGISADQAKETANFLLRVAGLNPGTEPVIDALANMAGIAMEVKPMTK